MIKIESGSSEGQYVVRRDGAFVADFIYHKGDNSTGLRLKGEKYAPQNHLPNLSGVEERVQRIFDDTPLEADIEKLKSLHAEQSAIWDEKASTADSRRYNELVEGGLLRQANVAFEIQRDIVRAKITYLLGIDPHEMRDLGLC